MNKFALLFLLASSAASAEQTPSWLRLVDWDGQVYDVPGIAIDSITVCASGSHALRSHDASRGFASIRTAFGDAEIWYSQRFWNEGAVTENPNTTGDQIVFIEDADAIFVNGAEDCVVHR